MYCKTGFLFFSFFFLFLPCPSPDLPHRYPQVSPQAPSSFSTAQIQFLHSIKTFPHPIFVATRVVVPKSRLRDADSLLLIVIQLRGLVVVCDVEVSLGTGIYGTR